MDRETWYVCTDEEVITPEKLKDNPDKYGGLGMRMIAAIESGIVTIPIHDGHSGHCALQLSDKDAINRILAEGKVDVCSSGFWSCITSRNVSVYFHGTIILIPLWGGSFG